jgi:ABC-type branched-subunit amino acid transport system ATPase component
MNDNVPTVIQVWDLTKRFDDVEAVNGAEFRVSAGELFGFWGPNGAGKTTTINMLTGMDRHVFHQVWKRTREYRDPASGRGGRVHSVRHHFHALGILIIFCVALFALSLHNIQKSWIT